MLSVYYHPLSTFSQRVRIALLEKDTRAGNARLSPAHHMHRTPSTPGPARRPSTAQRSGSIRPGAASQ